MTIAKVSRAMVESELDPPATLDTQDEPVNKPQQNGEDLDPELSELVKQLLSKGMTKEACDELMDKFPIPGNCNRLEAVRVNPRSLTA